MSKIQIKQIDGKPGYHVFIDGKEISNCVQSVQFPVGIQPMSMVPVTLNVIGSVDIDLQSAVIKVKKNANAHS